MAMLQCKNILQRNMKCHSNLASEVETPSDIADFDWHPTQGDLSRPRPTQADPGKSAGSADLVSSPQSLRSRFSFAISIIRRST
jgi:hypothetical protein